MIFAVPRDNATLMIKNDVDVEDFVAIFALFFASIIARLSLWPCLLRHKPLHLQQPLKVFRESVYKLKLIGRHLILHCSLRSHIQSCWERSLERQLPIPLINQMTLNLCCNELEWEIRNFVIKPIYRHNWELVWGRPECRLFCRPLL